MEKILLAEDDTGIQSFLILELEHEGYGVVSAFSGREALKYFEEDEFDLILLDVMLPELNGLEVLRRIRREKKTPVIMLTARTETFDIVQGLDAGADDYVCKPFAIEELLARIRALLRRQKGPQELNFKYEHKDLRLVPGSMAVYIGDTQVNLSKTEFLLLQLLMQNKNTVLSRSRIIDEVWGSDHFIEENSVDVYIRYLRAKIDDKFHTNYITTVRGIGYTIRDD